MVKSDSVAKGLASFIDSEILPKMGGWQKWVFGTAAGLATKRADSIVKELMRNPIVKALGLVTDDGLIDLDSIYSELSRQASKGPAVIQVMGMGDLRLTAEDVDSIYQSILAADGQ